MEQEQKRLLIHGARILNPARGEDYIGNILISGDRISAVSESKRFNGGAGLCGYACASA